MLLRVKTIINLHDCSATRFIAFALIPVSLVFSSTLHAKDTVIKESQFNEPLFETGLGTSTHKKFTIIPRYKPDKNCIYIENDDTTFYIYKPLLEQLRLSQQAVTAIADVDGPIRPEKKAAIRYANYAKIILDNQLSSKDKFGCTKIKATLSAKTLYLIKRLLNSGQVAVLDKVKNKFTKKITVKYTAKQNTLGRIAYMTATIPSKSVLLLRWKDYL